MKSFLLIIILICSSLIPGRSQELPALTEQQLEESIAMEDAEIEDDTYLQQLAHFSKHPLNLNTVDIDELRQPGILTEIQVQHFFSYRKLLGPLQDMYELQAIPSWDITTIRRLLPFVTIGSLFPVADEWKKRWQQGEHTLLLRMASSAAQEENFPGSNHRLLFRYRYAYKNLLQYGVTGDKDAGESFLKGAQKAGFDFYSFHVFIRNAGKIVTLALGDYTVHLGQGLVHWQGLTFKKGGNIMQVKRQAPVLKPYNSAGEFNFHRGAGVTLRYQKMETTLFFSWRKLDATLEMDSLLHPLSFSAFRTSGYHRTAQEIASKNNLQQWAAGANARYRQERWEVGINAIWHSFSLPLDKGDEPYERFAIRGNSWYNLSMDYSSTFRNMHVFGEIAMDKNFHRSVINGIMISVDAKADVSIIHRLLDMKYQAINANAFTESTSPGNESGVYAGISLRPSVAWRLDAYADVYRFPWLRHRVNAPSEGKDFLVQVSYTPNRRVEVYTRFRHESKQGNTPRDAIPATGIHFISGLPVLSFFTKQNWRTHLSCKISQAVTVRHRTELVAFKNENSAADKGFLAYMDIIYKPLMRPFSAAMRLQYFETGSYDSRVYAYENDVLFSYSIPAFSGVGYRYYFTGGYDLNKKISCWLRWAQTITMEKNNGEWKIQIRIML